MPWRRTATAIVALAAVAVLPRYSGAQTLSIPMKGHSRPIHAETLFHSLVSNFFSERDRTTYVQTGDIPAMWLRDSAAQAIPYIRFVTTYPKLHNIFFGVIQRDAKNILVDPYAEAFSANYHVWERKWEIDSLAWPVLLVFAYYANTRDRSIFTPQLHSALRKIVDTLQCEQHHATCSAYRWPHAVSTHDEYNRATGLIWGAFRPSDEPVTYRYNIPQNAMAAVALRLVTTFARDAFKDDRLADRATSLGDQVEQGIDAYGRIFSPRRGGWMYAYETDGYGNYAIMDDANIPNLTALPYLGWCSSDDPVYLNTRRFTLSPNNPYYYRGTYAQGLGSSHTARGWIWPLGIIAEALTARTPQSVSNLIAMLNRSGTLDGLMHESFNPNDPRQFTRPEFGWANAFWADLIFRTVAGYPATPLGLLESATPGERQSEIPTITPVWAQVINRTKLVAVLGRLLSKDKNL